MLFNIGNAMAFAGIPNAKDRADVVAYIKEAKWTHWTLFKPQWIKWREMLEPDTDFVLIIDESAKICNLVKSYLPSVWDINIAL